MRGPLRWAEIRATVCNRHARLATLKLAERPPHPRFASLARPLPARRGEVKRFRSRDASALPRPACGERVGVRGPLRWARTRGAQNRGAAPSPSLRIADASHRRFWQQERRPQDAYALPARRGEVKRNPFSRRIRARALFDSFSPNRGEAERRQAQPTIVRATHPSVAARTCCGRGSDPSGGRSPLGAPPRLLSSDRMLGLSPGRASRERAGTGVTRAVNRA